MNIFNKIQNKIGINAHPFVFPISALLVILFISLSIFCSEQLLSLAQYIQLLITKKAGWIYILTVNIFLVFGLYLCFSRLGKIKIGGPKSKIEFSNKAWVAMLFSAGMGVGLVFSGAYEPLSHYANPPLSEPYSIDAAKMSMALTFFHWGLHPWIVYALVGLAIAFFAYNKNLPLSIRSIFYPILGRKIFKSPGNLIDIFATVASIFGLATSMGFAALQVSAGINHITEQNLSPLILQIGLIVVITTIALISILSGLNKGIKKLSEVNIILAFALMLFVFLFGPKLLLIGTFIQNIGFYLSNIIELSTWNAGYKIASKVWQENWTLLYWSWWIAWSPFVGIFIARISKGRTIKEFLINVVLIPSLITFAWMTIFGNTAIAIELFNTSGHELSQLAINNPSIVIFSLLDKFPFPIFSSLLTMLVLIIFFVTSLDSGALVIDTITAGGQDRSTYKQKAFWVTIMGAITICLLVGKGIKTIKTFVIISSFPFTILLLFLAFTLYKGLKREHHKYMQDTNFNN